MLDKGVTLTYVGMNNERKEPTMTYSATQIKDALREAAQQNGGRATRADAIALLDLHASIVLDEEVRPIEAVAVYLLDGTRAEEGRTSKVSKRFHTRQEAEDWGQRIRYSANYGTVKVHMTEYVLTPIGEEPWATASIDLEGRFWDWEG